MRVLVVDDDQTSLTFVRLVLGRCGHEVLTRDSAIGTTAVILKERPDVVLLDVHMPALKGGDLVQQIRKSTARRDARVVVLLFSALDEAALASERAQSGADGALVKTADPNKFVRDFDAVVAHARAALRFTT